MMESSRIGQKVLGLRGIGKSFSGNPVLRDVSVEFAEGEIHAIIGENGAGKSTLGKIVGGLYRPDSGRIDLGGRSLAGWTTRQALAHGVATIQQELCLVPDLTVAENVFLGIEHRRWGVLRRDLLRRFQEVERTCHLGLDPNQIVRDLPLALQQKVEIMRAFARQARIIIMDEPTSSLTGHETELLHSIMHTVVRSGRTMIYITHMLEAVLEHADRVTVLRDGNLIRTADTGRETKMSLVESMLGSPVDIVFPDRKRTAGTGAPPTLELRQVRSGAEVQDVSLHIDRGEVVGLAGLVGSGRTEVVRAIFGARPLDGGVIRLRGNLHRPRGPRHSIGARVALIPEDRRRQGLVLTSSVQRNIGLLIANRTGRLGHVSEARERAVARELIQELAIHPGDETYQVGLLSGGNQQKVLFAKWMTIDADLILLDEPTRGVDVGAKLHIYRLIAQLAASGASILLISSELEEVMNMSHRVYVMSSGRTVAEVDPAAVSMQEVLSLMFGMTSSAAPPR